MCTTKYISSLFIPTLSQHIKDNQVQVTMRRSDGEIFSSQITLLSKDEADKVKKLINYLEEVRTCECTKATSCEFHRELRKV